VSRENVEVVHRFFDAFERRDRDDVAALLHPQVEWRTMGAPLLGAEAMHGRDEALRFMFEQIGEAMDFRATLEEVSELPGGQVLTVAHYEFRGVASGAGAGMTAAAIYRFEANQIVFFQDFATRDEALDAAGQGE
jgi:ketosteroid isomerase-like protein